jgi:hypothetical protein
MSPPPGDATVRDVEQFDEVLDRWAAAEADGDADRLAALLDDEFRGDGPAGYVLTKAEWLARHRAGTPVERGFAWRTTGVREAGATVVATGEAQDPAGRFRATLVAVRRGRRWVIANLQLDRLPPPPGEAGPSGVPAGTGG